MPIYEYICTVCQHQTEQLQKMSDPPLAACPQCGGPVYRPISRTSFQLKGSGWYKDGYGSAKPETPAKQSADSVASASAKTDTAAKSEPAGAKSDGGTAKTGDPTAAPAPAAGKAAEGTKS